MINPKINMSARTLGGLASGGSIFLAWVIGEKFGLKAVDIFFSACLFLLMAFIAYWIVKLVVLFLKSAKE